MNRCRIVIGLFSALLLAGPATGQSSAPATPANRHLLSSQKKNPPCQLPANDQPAVFDVHKYSLVGNGVHFAKPLHDPDPEYPEEARKAGLNGAVVVALAINDKGDIDEIKVICSTDQRFEPKALEALKQWQFAPGNKDGDPVAVQVMVSMEFRLN